jgi:nitroimidazol reductase NimA-like FMN-containing flavoprotein (pyridoxamine 5'-phosphate oxidase superfamily)
MLKVTDLSIEEAHALLQSVGFGHLGCTRDDHPYVVPMHYAYDSQDIYFFTNEGTKTEYMAANSEVCFQVEEVIDSTNWRSVMVLGHARRLSASEEIEHAMQFISKRNPTLTPALNKTDIGAWHRLSNIAVYRVRPDAVYGRKTINDTSPA